MLDNHQACPIVPDGEDKMEEIMKTSKHGSSETMHGS